ncbi:toll/interleukin-1 receptor domain-containing protein [Actinomadura terrae]|uniref:toll/interleukin-1 receptor domain-containing protein n=1 Tax=Actinomadura terrae TaxID=604353 RepID=UPI001FA7CCEB|nr:toll/interleukin-1 receptor domain-containing protein [Actinomadura terrae]
MRPRARSDNPQVYLCYADADQGSADRLHEDLVGLGVRTFRPQRDTLPGDQIVHTIEKHIGESDYFLLLWSSACADEPWLRDQWHSTLREEWRGALHRNRGFLFVLRLDGSDIPALLSARRRFDAFADWDRAVGELAGTWRRDRALGHPVLPAPGSAGGAGLRTNTIYIRNRALDVSHVLAVPADATGAELRAQVRAELALMDEPLDFGGGLGGRLSVHFSYDLLVDERPVPDLPLDRIGVADGSVIDLKVTLGLVSLEGEQTDVVFRRDPDYGYPGLTPAVRRSVLRKAFGHLIPRGRR